MKNSKLLINVSRMVFPFIVLFGLYVILHGANSPGGGFQGGAILATGFLITYFSHPSRTVNVHRLVIMEKNLFFILLLVVLTQFLIPITPSFYLMALNLIIGLKVAIGLTAIVAVFIEEGR